MATVNQVFPSAPMGRRVVLTTGFSFLVVLGVPFFAFFAPGIVNPGQFFTRERILRSLVVFIPAVLLIPSFLYARSKAAQFSIEDNVLVLRKKRYPLEGLVSAVRDSEVLRGARKRMGNGGLACISGCFRSKRLGKFEACLTDPDHAVVLTWPDRVVAVSPADPEFFIYSARAGAGLR